MICCLLLQEDGGCGISGRLHSVGTPLAPRPGVLLAYRIGCKHWCVSARGCTRPFHFHAAGCGAVWFGLVGIKTKWPAFGVSLRWSVSAAISFSRPTTISAEPAMRLGWMMFLLHCCCLLHCHSGDGSEATIHSGVVLLLFPAATLCRVHADIVLCSWSRSSGLRFFPPPPGVDRKERVFPSRVGVSRSHPQHALHERKPGRHDGQVGGADDSRVHGWYELLKGP